MKTKIDDSTPVMRQFSAIKAKYPDALLLFRMGDFYETFREDAKTAARILNITLTKRANGKASTVPLAGFPHHALENYLHKLLKEGLKVAICEQVEDPKTAKGIVKREVVELVTPGTSISDRFLEKGKNNYLVSIYLREKDAGIAVIDISTGEFFLLETAIARLKENVLALHPAEIICQELYADELQSLFGKQVLRLTGLEDWLYQYDAAYEMLTEHFGTTSLKGFGCEQARLGIVAAGPVLHYLRQNYQHNLGHITSLRYESDDQVVLIDDFTQRNLEIFETMQSRERRGSLLHSIDSTITALGSRLLKKWILRPLRSVDAINARLEQVAHFFEHYELRSRMRDLLKRCSDLERLISRISASRASAREVVSLRFTLELVPEIRQLLANVDIFTEVADSLHDFNELVELIRRSLQEEDLPLSVREGGFIRSGFSAELDEYRDLIRNGKQWIANLQSQERQRLGIPSLKVGYNRVFGYYIDVTKPHVDKVPETYIRKQTLVNSERFITPELKEYEEKLLSAEEKMADIEYRLFQQLCASIMQEIARVQRAARAIANLDVLSSFAEFAEIHHYHRPEITAEDRILIKAGRHPVVEQLLPPGEKFVANDLEIDNREHQILIVTGPNMAGKSTYLRQVGLIVLLAQVGSFVPAEEARIGVVDKIFTRVGASDNLAAGESTFLMEMNETANILNNVTPKSLVLLDEIGRGTSTYDGMAIAWAVTEYLHENPEIAAKTLFATHYHELTDLEKIHPRVRNLTVKVREHGDKVVFLRKIVSGSCDKSYGIHVAQMAGVPNPVIQRANEILANLSTEERALPSARQQYRTMESRSSNQLGLFELRESRLRQALSEVDVNQMTPLEALQKLHDLQTEFGEDSESPELSDDPAV